MFWLLTCVYIVLTIEVVALCITMLVVGTREMLIQIHNPSPRFSNGFEKRIDEIELIATKCIDFGDFER